MKKYALILIGLLPTLLLAAPQEEVVPPKKETQTPAPIEKGLTSKGRKLVEKIWDLVNHHKWASLKKKMHKDFSGLDIYSNIYFRKDEINFLKSLHILDTAPFVLNVTSLGDKVISVQYALGIMTTNTDPNFTPSVRMSVFQKEHDEWLWKNDADLNVVLTVPE